MTQLLGVAELAARWGVVISAISNATTRKSKRIPPPDFRLAQGPIWYLATIIKFEDKFNHVSPRLPLRKHK